MFAMLLLISMQECARESGLATANYSALQDTTRHFKNKLDTQTATISTLQLKNKDLQAMIKTDPELKVLAKEFVAVKSVQKFSSTTNFAPAGVKFDEPIYKPADTATSAFKRTGRVSDPWYRFAYKVTNDSLVIDSLSTWTTTTVLTGFKSKWFLGKQTLTTDITNSNPHIFVYGITSAEVIIPEPWYRKWYVWLAAGLVTGALIK